jgi:hypothetical protein
MWVQQSNAQNSVITREQLREPRQLFVLPVVSDRPLCSAASRSMSFFLGVRKPTWARDWYMVNQGTQHAIIGILNSAHKDTKLLVCGIAHDTEATICGGMQDGRSRSQDGSSQTDAAAAATSDVGTAMTPRASDQ